MSLLALDLGTRTGWTARTALRTIAHGWVAFKEGPYIGGGTRYLRFGRWLDQLRESSPVGKVVFEKVRRHLSVAPAYVYGGTLATLTAWCEAHGVPYRGVPVATIKRTATGGGNASKGDVIAAVQARGFTVADENKADSLAVLMATEEALK